MSLIAGNLISAAEKRTYGNQGRQKISHSMLLEELTAQDQLVVQLISQSAPDLLATITGSIVLTDAGNTNGYTLEQGVHYRNFAHANNTDLEYKRINIIRREFQDAMSVPPAATLRSGAAAAVFYPIDPSGKRWQGSEERAWFNPDQGDYVTYSYVPRPVVLTALTNTLTSPDMAREVFVSALEAAILLSAVPKTEAELAGWQVRLQAAMGARQAALSTFLLQVVKYVAPQGNPGLEAAPLSESEWVAGRVGG